MKDQKIDRLLRSAAQAREEAPAEMPFGFDTRVVALWPAAAGREAKWHCFAAPARCALVVRSDRYFDVGGCSRAQTKPGTVQRLHERVCYRGYRHSG